MIKAGIIGGSGYTGGELIRLLIHHKHVQIQFVYSTTRVGEEIYSAHPDLLGLTTQKFVGNLDLDIDVLFLCLGHGNSIKFLNEHPIAKHAKIIDLSTDFRLQSQSTYQGDNFVYGLPELHKTTIEQANYIANPGCFATAINLALLPLAKDLKLASEVHINAVTGSTGAGIKPASTTHFSWRNSNVSWYKPFTHQHLGEIEETVGTLQENHGELLFLPQRGNFTRGIYATAYTHFEDDLNEAFQMYNTFYQNASFTSISKDPIFLKQVVNTNNCHIHLHKHKNMLLITSVIDNLLKGASGQAVQNMNLMFNLEENEGLQLKSSVF